MDEITLSSKSLSALIKMYRDHMKHQPKNISDYIELRDDFDSIVTELKDKGFIERKSGILIISEVGCTYIEDNNLYDAEA